MKQQLKIKQWNEWRVCKTTQKRVFQVVKSHYYGKMNVNDYKEVITYTTELSISHEEERKHKL